MSTKTFVSLFAGLAVSALLGSAIADSKKPQPQQPPQLSEEMQKQFARAQELGAPGAEHAVLKAFEGDWTVKSRSWMKPGDKAQEATATSNLSWVLGGRFLKQKYSSNWNGQPFEGIGFLGYDKMKKTYVSFWLDNISTGVFQSTGQYNAETKTLADRGTFSCPMTGKTDEWFRSEWRILSPTQHVFSMYMKDEKGTEFKSMELTYDRSKEQLSAK